MEQNKSLRFVARSLQISASIPILIGIYWLLAWTGGWAPRWSAADVITVKTNMALGQILAGVALLLAGHQTASPVRKIFATAITSLVFLTGALTLFENLQNVDLGIDQLLARELPGAAATVSPNRIGLPGSLSLTLISAGIFLLLINHRSVSSYLGVFVCIINLVPAVGYLFDIDPFFSQPKLTGIAWPTVLALISLGLGLIFARGNKGLIANFLSDNPGGVLLRRFLPAIVLIPLVTGFLVVKGERSDLFDSYAGIGVLVIVMIVLLLYQAILISKNVNRSGNLSKLAIDALRKSEEKFRTSVESLSDGFAILSSIRDENNKIVDFRYDYINEAGAGLKLSKRSRKEHIGKTILELTPDVKSSKLFAEYIRVAEGGGPLITDSLSYFDVYGNLSQPNLIFDFRVTRLGERLVVVWRDITGRKRAEIELQENNLQLKELIATKNKFFNIIAHDLKNPFTSLIGSSELLVENIDQLGPEQIKSLALIINDASKYGYGILQNLLDWSRSQTGMLKLSPEKINLRNLIDEQIKNLSHISANKQIEISSLLLDDMFIVTDRNVIEAILRNLINNAIKFTQRNGMVSVSAVKKDDNYIISVKDNGIGISPENIENIFKLDIKHTRPGTENEQGTGLGLKLCSEFVEKLNGRIWVESYENVSSEFKFSIPVNEG